VSIEVVIGPVEEPVTVTEAKAHLRVEVAEDDALIGRLITDAREWAERHTQRSLCKQTWRLWLDAWPNDGALRLPGGKVLAVTHVKYTDSAGAEQTVNSADYTLVAKSPDRPARIVPAYGKSWPSARDVPNAVQVEYEVGYGDAADVPAIFKQSILLHVGWHYEHREPSTFGTTGEMPQILGALKLKLCDLRLYEFG